jgi:acyl-CoA ligase (AMP-forming) (exosortase A-associated)
VTRRPAFTLDDLLVEAATEHADRVAVVDGPRQFTYRDLLAAADALAAAMVEVGVGRGDRVGIYQQKSWEAIVAMLATSRVGAAFVNLNPALKAPQVEYIARDAGLRLLVADTDRLDALDPAAVPAAFHLGPPPRRSGSLDLAAILDGRGRWGQRDGSTRRPIIENDLGTILYTSGSTGLPKGVAFSHRNLVVGAEIVSTYLDNSADDRILSVLPFSFDYGLNQLTTAIRVGATLVVQRSQLPGDILRSLRRHAITGLAGVPPVWALLLRMSKSLEAEPLPALRYITNSGGRIPQPHLDSLRRLLPGTRIFLMYGLTEAFRSTYLPPEELDRGSTCIGRAIPDTEILVVKDGRACAPGEVGELVHRGPTVALGYWGNREATDRVYRPNPLAPPELLDVERVVYSGDLVRMDEDGYLYFVGRNDAMIKSGGFRISPEEVENLLIGSGLVLEACAFGIPDPDEVAGQVVKAVVSLRDEALAGDGDREQRRAAALQAIRDHLVAVAPSYLSPREIVILDELPRGATGKIDRVAIAEAHGGDGVHAG